MTIEKEIILPDGRTMAYAEFGSPDGRPVMYFHGIPMCRLEPLLIGDETFMRLGLRIIAPDRPGIGRSSFQLNRAFLDWPRDIAFLADALGLDQFGVIGNSAGAPYVAACAIEIPERLSGAVVVSGAWRIDWPETKDVLPFSIKIFWFSAKHSPTLLRLMLKAISSATRALTYQTLARLKKRLPLPDYLVFAEKPERIKSFGKVIRESMRNGTKGPAWDIRMYIRDFDFQLQAIKFPITLFHGELDNNVPVAVAQRACASIPGAKLVSYQNDAHLSTLCNHMDDFARALTGG